MDLNCSSSFQLKLETIKCSKLHEVFLDKSLIILDVDCAVFSPFNSMFTKSGVSILVKTSVNVGILYFPRTKNCSSSLNI